MRLAAAAEALGRQKVSLESVDKPGYFVKLDTHAMLVRLLAGRT